MQGELFIVALPIGNPKDITLRAIEVLNSVSIIAAEDTRKFATLAEAVGVKPRQVYAYHDHNESESANELIKFLKEGARIAIVSDAGTPMVNDPGFRLIERAYQEGIKIIPIPGASSVTTVLSVSPIGGNRFAFLGYAPSKSSERKEFLLQMKGFNLPTVVFETPHRLLEHLEEAVSLLEDPQIFVGREMTKTYEEYLYQKASSLLEHFKKETPKGEFVLVYAPIGNEGLDLERLSHEIRKLLDQGLSSKDILERFKHKAKLARQDLYNLIQELKSRKS